MTNTNKTYDEQLKALQKKISKLKADKREKDRKRTYTIGEMVVRLIPDLLQMFEEDNFDLEGFLKNRLAQTQGTSEKAMDKDASESDLSSIPPEEGTNDNPQMDNSNQIEQSDKQAFGNFSYDRS